MPRWERPLQLLAAGMFLVAATVALPVLLTERTRDWTAYEQAATRLEAGSPLYLWELKTEDDEYYLYPPGMAAAWAAIGSPQLLAAVKVLALLAVASLGPLVAADRSGRSAAAVALGIGALLWPPNLHDLILGNVMALYVGALSIVILRRGWLGAAPIGIVIALAAKPAVVPFLIWLAIRRPSDAVRAGVTALLASVAVALVFGAGRYVEYLDNLPRMIALATPFTGNVGLVTLSPLAGYIGIGVAWALAVMGAVRLDERRGAAIVLAAMLLAQPTIGFNYAGLLFPALALLWGADSRAGALGFAVVSPLVLVSPIAAAFVVIALAAWSAWSCRSLDQPQTA